MKEGFNMPKDLNVGIYGVSINANGELQVTTEGAAPTYGVAGVAITPAANPTDVVVLSGSATKTIRVKNITVSGFATTAGSMDVSIVKRTAANTGGTATNPTIGLFDSGDGTASATISQYSANPTALGAGVSIDNKKLNLGLAGAAGNVNFEYCNRNDKPIILRGAAQSLAINLNGQAVPAGGALSYSIEWEEDLS